MTAFNVPIIRDATIDDASGIARVHVDSWRATYRGIVPDDVLDNLSYERRAEQRRLHLTTAPAELCHVVAEVNAEIVGFAAAGPERNGDPAYDGELYAIYVLPSHTGQGIGRALVRAAAERLLRHDIISMLVWVLRDNPSRRFYEALGGVAVREKEITIGIPLVEVAYGWSDIRPLAGGPRAKPSL